MPMWSPLVAPRTLPNLEIPSVAADGTLEGATLDGKAISGSFDANSSQISFVRFDPPQEYVTTYLAFTGYAWEQTGTLTAPPSVIFMAGTAQLWWIPHLPTIHPPPMPGPPSLSSTQGWYSGPLPLIQ